MTRRRFLAACVAALVPAVPAQAADRWSVSTKGAVCYHYPLYRTEAELAAMRAIPKVSRAETVRLLKELVAEMNKRHFVSGTTILVPAGWFPAPPP